MEAGGCGVVLNVSHARTGPGAKANRFSPGVRRGWRYRCRELPGLVYRVTGLELSGLSYPAWLAACLIRTESSETWL